MKHFILACFPLPNYNLKSLKYLSIRLSIKNKIITSFLAFLSFLKDVIYWDLNFVIKFLVPCLAFSSKTKLFKFTYN